MNTDGIPAVSPPRLPPPPPPLPLPLPLPASLPPLSEAATNSVEASLHSHFFAAAAAQQRGETFSFPAAAAAAAAVAAAGGATTAASVGTTSHLQPFLTPPHAHTGSVKGNVRNTEINAGESSGLTTSIFVYNFLYIFFLFCHTNILFFIHIHICTHTFNKKNHAKWYQDHAFYEGRLDTGLIDWLFQL